MNKLKLKQAVAGWALLFGLPGSIHAQSMVNNGATLWISGAATLYINGGLQNKSGSALHNNGSLWVSDTLSTPGTLSGNGAVLFFGTGNKALDGTGIFANKLFMRQAGDLLLLHEITFTDSVDIGASSKLALNGHNLQVNGTLSGAGVLKSTGTSAITIGGTGNAGTLNMDQGNPGVSNRLAGITLNRTTQGAVALGGTLEVTGAVTLTSGTLSTGNDLTLVSSDIASTASIARIQPAADITGHVNVQRFIPAGVTRRWEFWGSPVSGFTFAQLIDDIYVTGPGGTGNGFDATSSNSPSAYYYDETATGVSSNGWITPATINTGPAAGHGWRMYYRGNKATQGTSLILSNPPAPHATVVDYTAAVNKGTVTPVVSCSNGCGSHDGWNLVANPYPSPIDWNAAAGWTKTNISHVIYVFNPTLHAYAVWDGQIGLNGGSGYLPIGQSFFIKATGTPVLSMTEEVKTTSLPATQLFKSAGQIVRIRLVQDSLLADEAAIRFEGSTNNLDYSEDALKMTAGLNISSLSADNYSLAINNHLPLAMADTIPLSVWVSLHSSYQLEFSMLSTLPVQVTVYLYDSFTYTLTDLRQAPAYPFTVTANPASHGNHRFSLIFGNAAPLPVTLLSFDAAAEDNGDVQLTWATSSETGTKAFEAERSDDRVTFTQICELPATGRASAITRYTCTDQQALAGQGARTRYYRLRQVDRDGSSVYSNTVPVTGTTVQDAGRILVYPVPAHDVLNAAAPQYAGVPVSYELLDMSGRVIQQSAGRTFPLAVNISQLDNGVYLLRLSVLTSTSYHRFTKN